MRRHLTSQKLSLAWRISDLRARTSAAQKDMIVRYFAEIKRLVGCVYPSQLALKVRD